MTTEEKEQVAILDGYTLYKECRTPTWYYECENWKWEELNISEVWVTGETELFKQTPCITGGRWKKTWKSSGQTMNTV